MAIKCVHQMLEERFDEDAAEGVLKDVLLIGMAENMEEVLEKKV